MVIWRFDIELKDRQKVLMPLHAKILPTVVPSDRKHGATIWAMVNPKVDPDWVEFYIVGTGHHMYVEDWLTHTYLGTYTEFEGAMVWHVFTSGHVER